MSPRWGSSRARCHLTRSGWFEAGDRSGYHAIVAMSLLLGGGMAVLVLLIFLVFPVALRLFD